MALLQHLLLGLVLLLAFLAFFILLSGITRRK